MTEDRKQRAENRSQIADLKNKPGGRVYFRHRSKPDRVK